MINLLLVAGATALVAATAALWVQGRRMVHPRIFAGLVSAAVTVILFSLIAWAAAAVALPVSLTSAVAGTLVGLVAVRLYRELKTLPTADNP